MSYSRHVCVSMYMRIFGTAYRINKGYARKGKSLVLYLVLHTGSTRVIFGKGSHW